MPWSAEPRSTSAKSRNEAKPDLPTPGALAAPMTGGDSERGWVRDTRDYSAPDRDWAFRKASKRNFSGSAGLA